MSLSWEERISMLSIHPGAADHHDIARLASELMERNAELATMESVLSRAIAEKERMQKMIDMKESHEELEQEYGREPYGVVVARRDKFRMRCARLETIIGDMMAAAGHIVEIGAKGADE